MQKALSNVLAFSALALASAAYAQEEVGLVFADSYFKQITVDGDVSDWAGIPPAYIDTVGDANGSQFDFAAAYLANDNNYLYIRITFAQDAPFGDLGYLVNLAFNTDLDPGTGFGFAGLTGSEFFVQSGLIFDQRSGVNFVDVTEQTPDNNYGAFAFADTAPYALTNELEIGIPLNITYSNDADGNPGLLNPDGAAVFEYPDFDLLFEAEDETFTGVEFMPNADPAGGQAGIEYVLAEGTGVREWTLY